jgi:signal transduction histidine kinase
MKSKLSGQLFKYYLFLVLLLILIIVITGFVNNIYINRTFYIDDNRFDEIDDFSNINDLYDEGFIEESTEIVIFSKDFDIIESNSDLFRVGEKITLEEFNDFIVDNILDIDVIRENDEYVLFIYKFIDDAVYNDAFADNNPLGLWWPADIYIVTIGCFLIFMLFTLFIYSRLTSKNILIPVKSLISGVSEITAGNYNSKIDFKAKNELSTLKDSINQMSGTIKNEIERREELEKQRKELTLYISHDLKTPLTNIQGYSQALVSDTAIDKKQRDKYLDIIADNSKRATNLIRDLFELSSLQYDKNELVLSRVNLCELLREIITNYINEFDEKLMEYSFDIPDEPVLINASKDKLKRAFQNIISNSIKYSGAKTKFGISIMRQKEPSPFTGNNVIEIIIWDTGPGIREDLQDIVFNPLTRGDMSRSSGVEGSGLGLAITKSIIEKHSGNIMLDKSYKNGTRFIISIPVL